MLIPDRPRRIAGWALASILGALFLASAAAKFLKAEPVMTSFDKWGLGDHRILIAVGELLSAALFVIPRTASLGTLLLGAYMGGAIVTHMQHGEPFVAQSVILALVWLAGWLRYPGLLESFARPSRAA